MGKISILIVTIMLTHCIFSSTSQGENRNGSNSLKERETLEIIIGGVPFTPPPESAPEPEPEPECPPPPPPSECPPPIPPPQSPPPPPPPSPPKPSPSPPPPPPPPKPTPPPPLFPFSAELLMNIQTIQKFKKQISYDPKNITRTWTGNNLCIDPSKYIGFLCAKFPGDGKTTLSGINFNGYTFGPRPYSNLTLTDFINSFDKLVFFHANSNNYTGDIPMNITKLVYFYELDLSNNKLRGEFPKAVLGAKNLTFIDLRFNFLTGMLPPEVFNLDLDVLFLNNNQFTGNIPDNFGNTHALYLTLAKNQLTGPIPKSIGKAKDTLVEVLFLGNKLSGCLPYEIGLLNVATVFDASDNKITGPIPHSFGCLSKMQRLNLSSNELFGPVPEMLCQLSRLYNLCLQDNYFTQVGPECRKLIMSKKLNMRGNCVLGLPNQKSASQCADFFSKPRICPDQQSMTYVPCATGKSDLKEKVEEEEVAFLAPSPSYAALEKPGL